MEVILQRKVRPEDNKWEYKLTNGILPPSKKLKDDENTVIIKFIKVTSKSITLSCVQQKLNRVLGSELDHLEKFILISFEGFTFKLEKDDRKVTSDYIGKLLETGIVLNSKRYIYYGHSNSQLKSKSCYLYNTNDGKFIMEKINRLGDFSKFQSVAKKAKRIGLLFSAAEASLNLDPKFTQDVPDIEANGYVYTDGCGMLSLKLSREFAKKRKIIFHNQRYTPSSFQIRYKGYKGMLMLNPSLDKTKIHAQFRSSMKKFSQCPDNNFCVLDYSTPFTFGYLNGEYATLLSSLGISNDILIKKQNEYFQFLEDARHDPKIAYEYLCYKGEIELAECLFLGQKSESILNKIKKLTREEWCCSFKNKDPSKEDEEKVRILIPDSRLLFGLADYTGTLKEGECFVRITDKSSGAKSITGAYVIVSRNPCLHPGDIRKFKAVTCEPLNHLIDVIVFPIVGKRDAASLMSGGDLDGDKFFVCWDPDLIPTSMSEPYGYPAAVQPIRKEINHKDMITYFANYNNTSLGSVKNLYIKWARVSPKRALSKECQQLNVLFSSCVDGERIRIPDQLKEDKLPKPEQVPTSVSSTFILDVLIKNIKTVARSIFKTDPESVETTPVELLEFILAQNPCCLLNEFELFKITCRWCEVHGHNIDDFICYFDFGNFTTLQKHAAISMLETTYWKGMRILYFDLFFNALTTSDLLTYDQLVKQHLQSGHIRWQKLYSSFYDQGSEIRTNLQRGLENFDKKLLVIQVDEQLTVVIYIPTRLEKSEEIEVDKAVKLFAYDPISGKTFRQSTVHGYKIFYDGELIQIYEKVRPNTFVWFALNQDFRKRAGLESAQGRVTHKVSIALQKFNQILARTHSRVVKQESYGFELYVISNRDREGHDVLDISMSNVPTLEILRNLENTPREYSLDLDNTDWTHREFCQDIIMGKKLNMLETLQNICEFEQVFNCCVNLKQDDVLVQIVNYVLVNVAKFSPPIRADLIPTLINLLQDAPSLSILLSQGLFGDLGGQQDENTIPNQNDYSAHTLLSSTFKGYGEYFELAVALLRCTNDLKDVTVKQFKRLPQLMWTKSVSFPLNTFTVLLKTILFNVRDAELANECLVASFSEEFPILDVELEGNPESKQKCVEYYKHFALALVMDYLGEAKENCPCDFWGIPVGAEELDKQSDINKSSFARRIHNLSEFIPNSKLSNDDAEIQDNPWLGKPIEPAQKFLNIKASSKHSNLGYFETILRIDVPSTIRNEDHLRFCATTRPSNKSKQRPTVFDAIARNVGKGMLEFEIMQTVPIELEDANWNLYVVASTMNLTCMLSALQTLICKKSKATIGFEDIVGIQQQKQPNGDIENHHEVQIPSNKFNESQQQAIQTALNGPVTLIWGPPGTGKTTVVVEIILQFFKFFPGKRILVTASTHKAVDNVMGRFLKEFGDDAGKDSDDFIRLTTDLKKVSPALQKWTLDAFFGVNLQDNDKAKGKAAKKVALAKIVFSTVSGSGVGLLRQADVREDSDGGGKKKKRDEKFDIVIIDEASQITEPNALIPLVKRSRFVVMVGDHVQLRPLVSEPAKEYGLETSLFQKLYESQTPSPTCKKVMLNVQYRMHPTLASFPSKQFYQGKLLSGVKAEDRILPTSKFPWPKISETNDSLYPIVFIHCPSEESYGKSKSNKGQALLTIKILNLLLPECNDKEIKILTPYTAQIKLITTKLTSSQKNVEVCTIDSFQGREADIIIFVTVRANCRQNLGFLDDHRRINVAVTRARRGMIIIGDESTIKDDTFWKGLLASCKKIELPK